MRALTYAAFGADPSTWSTVPDPTPPPGGAVVRVLASGLCRSDWHGWMGHDGDITTFPHVPGPRAGRGRRGRRRRRGCRVGGSRRSPRPFVMACGALRRLPGRSGPGLPEPAPARASPTPGSFAELVVVHAADDQPRRPARRARRRAWRPGWAAASPRPTARWSRGPRFAGASSVVVIGCGGVGLAAVAVARSRGALVCAVDVSAASLDRALFHGADEVVDASIGPDRVVAAVTAWSGGRCRGEHRRPGVAARRAAPASCRSAAAGGTCRWGCCRRPRAGPTCRWSGSSAGSSTCSAATAWRPPTTPRCSTTSRAGGSTSADLLAPGEPLGLEAAGAALEAMGSTPSRGIVLVDPTR